MGASSAGIARAKAVARQLAEREPLRVWALAFTIGAVTIQALAYSVTATFYSAFGLTPEEVGFTYTDFLGRRALQVALTTALLALLLVLLSIGAGFYSLVGSFYRIIVNRDSRERRRVRTVKSGGETEPVDRHALDDETPSRSWSLAVIAIVAVICMALLFRVSDSLGFGLAGSRVLTASASGMYLLIDGLLKARDGRYHDSFYVRIFLTSHYVSSGRLLIFGIGVALVVAWTREPSTGGQIAAAINVSVLLVIVERIAPRSTDFDPPLPPVSAMVAVRSYYSAWATRLLAVLVVSGLSVSAISSAQWLINRNHLVDDIIAVRSGHSVVVAPLSFNPFELSAPRAERASVSWIASGRAPDPFNAAPTTLIFFGSANGVSVFFDFREGRVLRLPTGSLEIQTDDRVAEFVD